FTMSLFIGNLAFAESPLLVDEVKVGVLAGSVLAALAGMLILRFSPSHPSR
ncbi:TPA: Na+/H+ antiporter NhaA, partial [Klebsiella michiganensis]|nr:Na+/H+ antiporter NhaA [Klebsiella michiganensis]